MVILIIFLLFQPLSTSSKDLRKDKPGEGPFMGSLHDIFEDEGEVVEVKYLTKPGGDYHIIQLRIPTVAVPISIHLIPTTTVSPVLRVNHDGQESKVNLENCFYFGHITEHPGGTSALTDCGELEGFSGHILLGEDHFVLEPVSTTTSPAQESEGKGKVLLHRVFRAQNILDRENSTYSDMLRVPQEELKKAVSDMECEDSDEENQDPLLFHDSDEVDFTLQTFASKSKEKNKKKKGRKMTVAGSKVVEIAVFTDEKLFKVWQKRYLKETKAKLKLFVLNLVNNMNLLYQQPSLGVDVSFRLVYLEILQGGGPELKSWDGEATKYLKSFCKYAGDKNTKGADWDHALLLTGHDLKEGADDLIAGMAWFTTMCLQYWSCSISEGTSFGSTFVVTHEIGHSLGMEHDGLGPSKACNEDKFLMSPTTGSGKITWSSCSTKNLKDFITKGTPELDEKKLSSIPVCITRASPLKSKRIVFNRSKLPGQIYDIKSQCRHDCGTNCIPYAKGNNVCSMLWCQSGLTIREAHPALEGTTCDIGKIRKMRPEEQDLSDGLLK